MATDLDLEQGIRCTITFTSEGKRKKYPHSMLRYQHAKGGSLEVPMDRVWNADVHSITVRSAHAQMFIPNMNYTGAIPTEARLLNSFQFSEMLMSNGRALLQRTKFDSVEIDAIGLGSYLMHFPIDKVISDNRVDLIGKRTLLQATDLHTWHARTWIDGGFEVRDHRGGAFEVHPKHKLVAKLERGLTQAHIRPKVRQLASFWEFMMHRTIHPGQVIYRNTHEGHIVRHMFKDGPVDDSPAARFQTAFLQVHWAACEKYRDRLLRRWHTLNHGSAWMENIIRVIRYRELPPDIRFFMAYTALHGFAAELGLGIPLSTHTNENVRMWEGFKKYWHIFLLNLTPNMRDYVDKLVLTRHHFAHRSKADENVLESFEEYSEAYAYIMVVIKIMFIDAAGLPKAQWTAMLEHWSYRLQGAFKPLVPGRKSKIETIWFFEPSP